MKKILSNPMLLIIMILFVFCTIQTFAIFRKESLATGSIDTASWNVTRSHSQSGDSIDITPGTDTDNYLLTVSSTSEVDVIYSIIISNLPNGVEVDLDNSGNFRQADNGTITIRPAGTINYNDSIKTKNHTLTFRATSGATPISDQEIDIDVEFKQDV
jgi:hypothetical protein